MGYKYTVAIPFVKRLSSFLVKLEDRDVRSQFVDLSEKSIGEFIEPSEQMTTQPMFFGSVWTPSQWKFRNPTSDYTESCRQVLKHGCWTAEMFYSTDAGHEGFWRVGIALNAVFFHSLWLRRLSKSAPKSEVVRRSEWLSNQLNLKASGIWIWNHLSLTSLESQSQHLNLKSLAHLNPKSMIDNQITWNSNQLTTKSLDAPINWQPKHLNLKSLEPQSKWVSNQLKLKWTDNKNTWTSNRWNFKAVESQIAWISSPLNLKPNDMQNNWI